MSLIQGSYSKLMLMSLTRADAVLDVEHGRAALLERERVHLARHFRRALACTRPPPKFKNNYFAEM